MNAIETVLVTGGAGYVGAALVPSLLACGYRVKVLDLYLYGDGVLDAVKGHPNLEQVKGDLRDRALLERTIRGCDAVIHLACISNDPSFELNPALGRSINYDAFGGLLQGAIDAGVKRFIYASSSSIYGVKETPDVREEAEPLPLTDYSKFKLDCERDLLAHPGLRDMTAVIVRPATLCGYAPRLRLDLTVNILTIHALVNRKIRIFGGKQLRPNLNIKDMVRAYEVFLEAPAEKIHREAFNVGFENKTVEDIAVLVRETLGDPAIELEYTRSSDNRSYHVNSDKVTKVLGFEARYGLEDAIRSIADAWEGKRIVDPMSNTLYSNILRMRELNVS
jgi:nucleoside-diphosphate-sugar epimerase